MVQVDSPQISVSEELFLGLARENPDVRFERASNGRLIVVPLAGGEGSRQNLRISTQLGIWSQSTDHGVAFDSSGGFRLPSGSTYSPDAAWIEKRRWQQLTPKQRRIFVPVCPDFVIELLSPSDDLEETREKLDEFIANGASLGWLIDPLRRVVEIYRPAREPKRVANTESVSGEGALASFVLDLRLIFDDPAFISTEP